MSQKNYSPFLLLLTSYIRFLCPQAVSVKNDTVTSYQASLKEMMGRTKLNYVVPLPLHLCSYLPIVL